MLCVICKAGQVGTKLEFQGKHYPVCPNSENKCKEKLWISLNENIGELIETVKGNLGESVTINIFNVRSIGNHSVVGDITFVDPTTKQTIARKECTFEGKRKFSVVEQKFSQQKARIQFLLSDNIQNLSVMRVFVEERERSAKKSSRGTFEVQLSSAKQVSTATGDRISRPATEVYTVFRDAFITDPSGRFQPKSFLYVETDLVRNTDQRQIQSFYGIFRIRKLRTTGLADSNNGDLPSLLPSPPQEFEALVIVVSKESQPKKVDLILEEIQDLQIESLENIGQEAVDKTVKRSNKNLSEGLKTPLWRVTRPIVVSDFVRDLTNMKFGNKKFGDVFDSKIKKASENQQFTLFVPSNNAWNRFKEIMSKMSVLPVTGAPRNSADIYAERILNTIRYHIIVGRFLTEKSLFEERFALRTAARNFLLPVQISEWNGVPKGKKIKNQPVNIAVQDQLILVPNQAYRNGIIHIVSGVLKPDPFVFLFSNSRTSWFAQMLAEQRIITDWREPVIIFAPTNSALEKIGFANFEEYVKPRFSRRVRRHIVRNQQTFATTKSEAQIQKRTKESPLELASVPIQFLNDAGSFISLGIPTVDRVRNQQGILVEVPSERLAGEVEIVSFSENEIGGSQTDIGENGKVRFDVIDGPFVCVNAVVYIVDTVFAVPKFIDSIAQTKNPQSEPKPRGFVPQEQPKDFFSFE